MSKPMQWVLLLALGAVIAVLVWRKDYLLMQILSGVMFTAQGGWVLWRHYVRHEAQPATQLRWSGWVNLTCGLAVLCLTAIGAGSSRQ